MLKVCSLQKSFVSRRKRNDVLRGVDVDFPSGACTAVVGHNGSGKSTLLRCLVGLLEPDAGTVEFKGRRITPEVGLGIVFDGPRPLYPRLRVMEVVSYLLALLGKRTPSSLADARRILDGLGVNDLRSEIQQLSRGTQQKVAIAVALAGNPSVVVCDEPTSFLDASAARVFADELLGIARNGSCVIVATHDPVLIDSIGASKVLLQGGRAVVAEELGDTSIDSGFYLVEFNSQDACDLGCESVGHYLRERASATQCVIEAKGMLQLAPRFPEATISSVQVVRWELGA